MKTIGQELNQLTGHGVYSVAMIEDVWGQYGFDYSREHDILSYGGKVEKLGAIGHEAMVREIAADSTGGFLDHRAANDLMVDAVNLAEAVYRLLNPGKTAPGAIFVGRARRFKATVNAILKAEKVN